MRYRAAGVGRQAVGRKIGAYFCCSAIDAGGADQIQWPVSRWLLPLTPYSA